MNPPRPTLLSALWLALALAILPALSAQEAPPAPAAPEKSAEAPAQPAAETETTAEPDEAEPALRELAPAADSDKPASEKPRRTRRTRSTEYGHRSGDKPPMGSHTVPAGEKWSEAVSIFGDTRVDGTVADVAVSIMGNTTVNGTVQGEAVSVLGTTTINGKVKGVAVSVLGDMVLGPEAEVDGEVVVVLGKFTREPGAVTRGGVQEIGGFGPFRDIEWLRAYVKKCVLWARPLWFGPNLGWAWMIAGIVLLFYMMLALIFPRGIERCAGILEQRPGNTILAALLTALLSPVLFVLLAITGIGIVLIPFLAAGLFFGTLFGKASVCAWFGRRIAGVFGSAERTHAVVAVLLGGIVIALLYTVPVLGFILFKLFGVLGLGMVVYVLILSTRRDRPAAAAVAGSPVPPAPHSAPSSGFTAAAMPPVAPPPVEPPPYGAPYAATLPPVLSAAILPRAGFWIRFAASLLDFLIIGIATALLDNVARFDGPGFLFFSLATYSVVMWKTRGTTIGGVICGLKVVRLDDRPLDWGVAIVRALTGFLSFFVAGLGFIWVAFDDEKQSWHDKVAGTTIVRVPKGTPLL